MIIFEVMIKNIRNVLIIFFILQQLKSQISQFDKNGLIGFCEQTLQMYRSTANMVFHQRLYIQTSAKFLILLKRLKFYECAS